MLHDDDWLRENVASLEDPGGWYVLSLSEVIFPEDRPYYREPLP